MKPQQKKKKLPPAKPPKPEQPKESTVEEEKQNPEEGEDEEFDGPSLEQVAANEQARSKVQWAAELQKKGRNFKEPPSNHSSGPGSGKRTRRWNDEDKFELHQTLKKRVDQEEDPADWVEQHARHSSRGANPWKDPKYRAKPERD